MIIDRRFAHGRYMGPSLREARKAHRSLNLGQRVARVVRHDKRHATRCRCGSDRAIAVWVCDLRPGKGCNTYLHPSAAP